MLENKEKELSQTEETAQAEDVEKLKGELAEWKDKYLRLYAEFENYKRLMAKDKEELIKFSNEKIMKELLSVIDHLELALQHASNSSDTSASALAEGVNMTLKEFKSTLERFGLVSIEALGKPFDPYLHHAMSQVESDEVDENIVIAEYRKGYMLKDRVLRAALVGVSKRKVNTEEE